MSATFPTKQAARLWAVGTERDVRQPGWRLTEKITLAEWHERWEPGRIVARSTAAEEQRRWRKHVGPTLGGRMLHELRPSELQRWVGELPVGAATAHGCLALVQSMLTAAVRDGLIPSNPALGLRRPTLPRRPHRYLTPQEARSLLAVAGYWRPLVLTALHTGMRLGELCGLHTHRVDITRGTVGVVEVMDRNTIREYPKSSSSRRTLPLPPDTTAVLARLIEQRPSRSLLFVTPKGAPLSRHNFNRRDWHPMVEAAVLAAPAPRFHDLRHTYASWLVQAGVPLPEVQHRMGHASVQTTMIYSHLAPDGDKAVLAALRGANVGHDLAPDRPPANPDGTAWPPDLRVASETAGQRHPVPHS